MANFYATLPGVVNGPLTVNGALTVNNDLIRFGAAAPFGRVMKATNGDVFLTKNMGIDEVTRDVGTSFAIGMGPGTGPVLPGWKQINVAGTAQIGGLSQNIFASAVPITITGSVAEQNAIVRAVPALMMDTAGKFKMRVLINATVQGATATTVRLKFGGVTFAAFTFAATGLIVLEASVANRNATNAQVAEAWGSGPGSVVIAPQQTILAIDTTVDEAIAVTIQHAATTDSMTLDYFVVDAFGNA